MGAARNCPSCGRSVSFFAMSRDGACDDCIAVKGRDWSGHAAAEVEKIENEILRCSITGEAVDWRAMPPEIVTRYAAGIILSTAPNVPGREVAEVVTVIGAETALGMNVFRDLANMVRDVIGGRSATVQQALRVNRETCLAELRREALIAGADAVIAIDLDYSEFSSAAVSGGMLFTAATGTAVRLVPLGS